MEILRKGIDNNKPTFVNFLKKELDLLDKIHKILDWSEPLEKKTIIELLILEKKSDFTDIGKNIICEVLEKKY